MVDMTYNNLLGKIKYIKLLKHKLNMLSNEFEMARISLESSINDEHEQIAICWLKQISEKKRIICKEIRRIKRDVKKLKRKIYI